MLLQRLGTANYSTDLIEGYSSLIWTERYTGAGEFELKTNEVSETMAAMPLGRLFTIMESNEIMISETHTIEDSDDGPVLTVSGRTYETFFENRTTLVAEESILDPATGKEYDSADQMNVTSAEAARVILNRAKSGLVNAKDYIPFLSIRDQTTVALDLADRKIPRADAYSVVMDLLSEDDLGIRTKKPNSLDESIIQVQIYNGRDLTDTFVLDSRAGDFENVKYLMSTRGYKTAAYSASEYKFVDVYQKNTSSFEGYERRVGLRENTDIKGKEDSKVRMTRTRGKQYLNANRKTTLFEGRVSPHIPYIYGEDYRLGDLVMCQAEYGISKIMRINEFIRIEDRDGERGYPTLIEP